MTPLTRTLEEHIAKPLGAWPEEEALIRVLKRRLTKKEYKVLLARAQGTPTREELMAKLALDDARYDAIWNTVIKKINYDAIKRELFSY